MFRLTIHRCNAELPTIGVQFQSFCFLLSWFSALIAMIDLLFDIKQHTKAVVSVRYSENGQLLAVACKFAVVLHRRYLESCISRR